MKSNIAPASTAVRGARAATVAALIPAALFYLGPRMYDLVATPYRLDRAVVSAHNYNPALAEIVGHEQATVAAFDTLADASAALKSVLVTDTRVTSEIDSLIDRIAKDLQHILDRAGTNVAALIVALHTLTAGVDGLPAAADGATIALTDNRATLTAILDDARSTVAAVHRARVCAESAADDLSGR